MVIERLFLPFRFWSTWITLLCASFGSNRKKKLRLMVRARIFWKKNQISIFWRRSRFQMLVCPFFFVLQRHFFNSSFIHFEELFFVHLLGRGRKKVYFLRCVHAFLEKKIFPFFLPKFRFLVLVFKFLWFRHLILKSYFNHLEELPYEHLLVVSRKKFTS